MATDIAPIKYEGETWPFHDEEDMPDTPIHIRLMGYIVAVLAELYRVQGWHIGQSWLMFGPQSRNGLAPDIAVMQGVVLTNPHAYPSWRIQPPDRPAPTVVFEIASDSTWEEDFAKLPFYALWGVSEVYIYDPGIPRIWKNIPERLRGWRNENGTMVALTPDAQDRLWSAALDSWLVPDKDYLRMADTHGNRRLTRAEAERAAKEAFAAKLRELGVDPDSLLP